MHYSDLSVGGDGGHGDGGDDGDDVGEDDHGEALEDAGLAHHPGQPQEQHHAPDVEETSHINPFKPAKLDGGGHLLAILLLPPVSQDTSAGGGEGDLWLPELPCDLPSEVSRGASARFTEDIVDAYNAMRTLQALLC